MNKEKKIKLYAKALTETLLKGKLEESKVVDNFLKLLIETRQEKSAKQILGLAESALLMKRGKRKIIFETARKSTPEQKKMLNSLVNEGDVVKEKINPEIIAGVRIIINDSQQLDASMRSRLQGIFSN